MSAPAHSLRIWPQARWLTWSAVGCGLLALIAASRRRLHRPTDIGRMSEGWLRHYEYTSGHGGAGDWP